MIKFLFCFRSPTKKIRQVSKVYSYLSPQCQHEGCSATIFVEDTKFLVCKQQLSHVSDYFRSLFMANRSIPISGASQNSLNEYSIVVSSFTHPPPALQFKWFLESIIQAPILRDITDDTLEALMRLSKRFRAQGLEMRCARYIKENVNKKSPMVALCWLNWALKHKFDKATHDACLPRVATSSLNCLEEHRTMITEKLLADLFAAKLRAVYAQAVNVFQTIHTMDHFYMDVDRCPRCGRQREQNRVRIYVSPCKRTIGCERCFRDRDCDIISRDPGSYQAFYRCSHGLIPLNDHTPDCQCQVSLLATQLSDLCLEQNDTNDRENN
uniref:BTB domain-containing protein n=1 Tax=Syphacia muris TaxID=451379 RepID=A0A0N5B1B1_9BILA